MSDRHWLLILRLQIQSNSWMSHLCGLLEIVGQMADNTDWLIWGCRSNPVFWYHISVACFGLFDQWQTTLFHLRLQIQSNIWCHISSAAFFRLWDQWLTTLHSCSETTPPNHHPRTWRPLCKVWNPSPTTCTTPRGATTPTARTTTRPRCWKSSPATTTSTSSSWALVNAKSGMDTWS